MIFRTLQRRQSSRAVPKVPLITWWRPRLKPQFARCPTRHCCHVRTALGPDALHSAGNFTKELVVRPRHSMALLMGRFLSARLSVTCGGRHSSSVSDPPCSLLPLGAASNTVQHVASVSKPTVVCSVLGAGAALVGMVLEESRCRL